MSKEIILYCPVRERPDIFEEALASHRALEGVSARWYFDDNVQQETKDLLNGENVLPSQMTKTSDYAGHRWTAGLMTRMGRIRDHLLRCFLESNAEWMLMVDSDVILHPQTAKHLSRGKGLIESEVYWTKWRMADHLYMPNVWYWHDYGFYGAESILRLRDPGEYAVGGLGAVTLIHRHVAELASYAPIVGSPFPGEDRHFCLRASAMGFELWADTYYPPFHVYRPEQLEEAKAWRQAGCPTNYFRDAWLNADWEREIWKTFGEQKVA